MKNFRTTFASPLKEAAWVTAGQILAFVGGLIGIKLLTNLMSPEHYGELALGLSVSGMVNMFLFGPLGQVVGRFYSLCREQNNLDAYARVLIRLYGQAAIFLVALGLPALLLTGLVFGGAWAALFGVALALGIFSGFQGLPMSYFNAMRDRRTVTLAQSADVWLRMGCAVALVFSVASGGAWALGGYLLGSLMVLIWLIGAAGSRGLHGNLTARDEVADARLRAKFMAYGLPFVVFAGLAAVSQYADRWLLQGFQNTSAVGVYAAMVQIASAPVVFLMAVANQLVIPVVFARAANLDDHSRMQGSRRLLGRSVLVVSFMYLIVTLAAYVWGDALITWMTHADYVHHAGTLWVIVLAVALFNLAQFMSVYGLSLNRPEAYFWSKFGQAVMFLVAGIPLARHGGVVGMAQALLVSSAVYFVWVWFVNEKLRREYGDENYGRLQSAENEK